MKKFAAVLMAVMMMVSAFAVAEETEETFEMTWEQGQAIAEQMELKGEFHTFDEIAVQIFIPADMTESELTEEDIENAFIGHFYKDEGATQVSIQYVAGEGITAEDMKAYLVEEGCQNVQDMIVNGLPAIAYEVPENGTVSLAFGTEMGNWLDITIVSNDEAFLQAAMVIFSSIQNVAE